jgi:hypothetical protein
MTSTSPISMPSLWAETGASGETAKPVRNSNKYAIGSAILWTPFFLIGHLLSILFNAAGYPIALDGTGCIYQAPTMIGSILYGFAGVLLVYRSCSRFFSRWSSVSAAILIWLATSVIYYMIAEPSMSHACSFFATALFLDVWLRYRPLSSSRQWILVGMAEGLLALVRLQDVAWLALPLLDASWAMRTDVKKHLRRQWKGFLFFGTAALVVFMPQIALWLVSEGARRYHTISTSRFHWLAPEMLNVLFSFRHGLYLWHPVLLFATGGLVLLYRRDRSLTLLLVLVLAAQLYLISAWYAWFFAQYRLGYISKYSAITLNQLTLGRFSMLLDMAQRIQGMI